MDFAARIRAVPGRGSDEGFTFSCGRGVAAEGAYQGTGSRAIADLTGGWPANLDTWQGHLWVPTETWCRPGALPKGRPRRMALAEVTSGSRRGIARPDFSVILPHK